MPPRYKAIKPLPILFAHRGGFIFSGGSEESSGSQKLRENSLAAFERTLKLKDRDENPIAAWGIESDAWLTLDKRAVLSHNKKISRKHFWGRLFKLNISRSSYSQLPSEILSLEQLYEALGTDFEFSLDIKDSNAIQSVISAAQKTNGAFEKLWICSPDFELLCSWRQRWPGLHLIHSTKLSRLKKGAESHLRDLSEAKIDGFNLHHSEYSPGLVSLIHRFGTFAFGWGTLQMREIVEALDMGLDAVYGDSPALLLAGRNAVYAPAEP